MATPSQTFQVQKSFFHNFSRVAMHGAQSVFESTMRNGHRVLASDVWVEPIPFCPTTIAADAWTVDKPNIARKRIEETLSPVAGTNNQLYRIVSDGTWINRWIAPTDSMNALGETSQGFAVKLTQNDGTVISLTEGVYVINYFTGLIEFQVGYTPVDLGYALPLKLTLYEYIGKTLADVDFGGSTRVAAKERFAAIDGQLTYSISHSPIVDSETVVVQGIFLDSETDYTIVANQITFNAEVIEAGKKIIITYSY
jgi:hypothetical protein